MENKVVVIPKEELDEMITNRLNQVIEDKIGILTAHIALKQNDVCKAIGVTDDTVRNHTKNGHVGVLQRDGSRKVYFELSEVPELKRRLRRKTS